jgi:hypothetical protein
MALVSKGDEFIAGGTGKRFKVESVSKGIVELKEQDVPDPEKKRDAELVHTTENNLLDSPDWLGIDD